MYVSVCIVIGLVTTTQAASAITYSLLNAPVTLKFTHNINPIGSAKCTHDNTSVAIYDALGLQPAGRWKDRGYTITNTNPGIISVVIPAAEVADDGVYVCKVTKAGSNAMPNVTLETYTATNVTETIIPKPVKQNVLEHFYKKKISVELTSNCSKPPVKFAVTTDTGYTANSTSKPCGSKPGHRISSLIAKIEVNDSMTISVSQKHPFLKDTTPKTYQVKLIPFCGSKPCAADETCTGDIKTYNCSCPGGYVNDKNNGTICKGAVMGKNKPGIRLGTGAIVGIAVGAVAVVAIIVVIVTLIVRRKKPDSSWKTKDSGKDKEPRKEGTGGNVSDPMLEKRGQTGDNKDSGVEDDSQNSTKKDEVKVDLQAGEVKMSKSDQV